jgi:hypothetical protein
VARTDRWRSHPVLGTILSVAAVVVPFAVSIAAAVAVGREMPHRDGLTGQALWWAPVLASSTVVFVGSERLCRRLVPLAALLKMTMLFPDHAPKRLKVAWRAGLTRDLERRSRAETSATGAKLSVPASVAEEILALAASLSHHDRKTRGHSERVRAYTDMIADELHLPQADRDRLRWSALLHDVGKLAVHPDVLNKDGKLTEEEWEEIRRHPLEGRRLIAPLASWLGPWSFTIEQHHERYDGSGYPFGLSGQEMSLGARIVAVADAFEVMTAARSYKKATSAAAARQELTRCAGSQFDPAIVRAFLNVSIGELRWTIGPVSWLADVPILTRLCRRVGGRRGGGACGAPPDLSVQRRRQFGCPSDQHDQHDQHGFRGTTPAGPDDDHDPDDPGAAEDRPGYEVRRDYHNAGGHNAGGHNACGHDACGPGNGTGPGD